MQKMLTGVQKANLKEIDEILPGQRCTIFPHEEMVSLVRPVVIILLHHLLCTLRQEAPDNHPVLWLFVDQTTLFSVESETDAIWCNVDCTHSHVVILSELSDL